MSFSLDARLAADTALVGDLGLSRALLMNDARFSWLILAPRRAGLDELFDLGREARIALMEEIALASEALRAMPGIEKINVGALGNIVNQLHAHVIGRARGDAAWPGPVWGTGSAVAYESVARETLITDLRRALAL